MATTGLLTLCCLIPVISGVFGGSWPLQVSREVIGEAGKAALLPCTFPPPHHHHHHGGVTVTWRVRDTRGETVVFCCSSNRVSGPCKPAVSHGGKIRLTGDPRHNDASVTIGNLTREDANRYYCRVELFGDRHDKYETATGTRLDVAAPPRIVNISVGFDRRHGYHALCVADGEPAPSLVWTDPHNRDAMPVSSTARREITSELHYLHQDGKYTCVATNSHGRAEGSAYFFRFRPEANNSFAYVTLWVALGSKVLMLLLMVIAAGYYSKDTKKSTSSVSQRAQESTYENAASRFS